MAKNIDFPPFPTQSRQPCAVYLDEIRKVDLYDKIWQAFAVLLPVRAVGVGDGRTRSNTAFLSRIATRIFNEVKGINRGGV